MTTLQNECQQIASLYKVHLDKLTINQNKVFYIFISSNVSS